MWSAKTQRRICGFLVTSCVLLASPASAVVVNVTPDVPSGSSIDGSALRFELFAPGSDSDGTELSDADGDGTFTADVPPGRYDLVVSGHGVRTQRIPMTVGADGHSQDVPIQAESAGRPKSGPLVRVGYRASMTEPDVEELQSDITLSENSDNSNFSNSRSEVVSSASPQGLVIRPDPSQFGSEVDEDSFGLDLVFPIGGRFFGSVYVGLVDVDVAIFDAESRTAFTGEGETYGLGLGLNVPLGGRGGSVSHLNQQTARNLGPGESGRPWASIRAGDASGAGSSEGDGGWNLTTLLKYFIVDGVDLDRTTPFDAQGGALTVDRAEYESTTVILRVAATRPHGNVAFSIGAQAFRYEPEYSGQWQLTFPQGTITDDFFAKFEKDGVQALLGLYFGRPAGHWVGGVDLATNGDDSEVNAVIGYRF